MRVTYCQKRLILLLLSMFVKLFTTSKDNVILFNWINLNNQYYDLMSDLALKFLYHSILCYNLSFNKEWKCMAYNMVFLVLLYMIINLFSCNNLLFRKIKILINVKFLMKISFSLGTLKAVHYLCEVLKNICTMIVCNL